MSQQIQITGGAKVRNLEGVLTGTAGVVNALGINVPSGIPQLDGSGKILVSQLPNSVMEYKGTWNAATNTPTLVNGTGNQGDVYLCNVAGTVNFGAGAITFAVGDQAIYSGTIWQKAGGSTGTVTSVAVTETGDALTITGSPITTSGTINIGFAGVSGQYVNGAGGLTTFPSLAGYVTAVTGTAPVVSSGGTTPAISMPVATASVDGYLDNADWTIFNNKQNAITLTTTGTSGASTLVGSTLNIPNYSTDLSGYVPYTGATANVNLGTYDLTADVITGATGSFASSGGSDTFAINHSSGSGIALNITKGGNGEGLYINKTSGSGNAATIIGTLNATTLVKSGGTSSQFLKADGSVDSSTYLTTSAAASTYVPYTGATNHLDLGENDLFTRSAIIKQLVKLEGFVSGSITNAAALAIKTSTQGFVYGGTGYVSITSNETNALTVVNESGLWSRISFNSISANRTFTFPNATGTIALTSDIPSLSGYIQGSGTTNYVPKFTASGTIGNSLIYDTGTRIAIGGTSATYGVLTVQSDAGQFCIQSNTTPGKQLQIGYDHTTNNSYLTSLEQGVAFTNLLLQPNGGNVGIGTSVVSTGYVGGNGSLTLQNSKSIAFNNFSNAWNTTSAGGAITYFTDNNLYIDAKDSASNMIFRVNGATERMRITSGGAIGMNTSSPDSATVLTLRESSSLSGALSMLNRNGNQRWSLAVDAFAVDDKYFSIIDNTNSAVRMVITPSGNVGIGTSSPQAKFSIGSPGAITSFPTYSTNDLASIGWNYFALGDELYVRSMDIVSKGAPDGTNGGSIMRFLTTPVTNGSAAIERMRITSGGAVGIGTSSIATDFNVVKANNGGDGIARFEANNRTQYVEIGYQNINQYASTPSNAQLTFSINSTERMRISASGQIFAGGSLGLVGRIVVFNESTGISIMDSSNNGGLMRFYNVNAVQIGSITTDASSTFFNTSSDYRLKEDLKEINGLAKVSAIKVYDFKWKNNDARMDGFIAHELSEVIPYAVHGQKDGEEMQSVDYSKIVPILVKAIQELKQELDELKNK